MPTFLPYIVGYIIPFLKPLINTLAGSDQSLKIEETELRSFPKIIDTSPIQKTRRVCCSSPNNSIKYFFS